MKCIPKTGCEGGAIQKNRSPKVEAKLVGSFTIAKLALNNLKWLFQCESPTVVKAIPEDDHKSG
jgi:hypothetical protein